MKQFDLQFEEPFKAGLRPESEISDDGKFLTLASNCFPYQGVLRSAEQWAETFPSIMEHCQIFTTIEGVFLLTTSKLYSYNGSNLTLLKSNIPVGSTWSCADFSPVIVFMNGITNVIRDYQGNWSIGSTAISKSYQAICHFRGRLLGGIGKTLDWSGVGNFKFLSSTDLDGLVENSAGTRDMDWGGTILAIHSLGKSCVIYGTGGITVIEPTHVSISDYELKQTITTFKFDNLDYIGIPSGQAVIKINESEHMFVKNDGYLYKLTSQGIQRLGYKEFIPAIPILLYNAQDGHEQIIIGGTNPSLLLTQSGAGTVSFNASAIAYDKRVGLMIHTYNGASPEQSTVMWQSDIFYLDRVGDKSIEQIILHAHDITTGTASVRVAIKMGYNDPWTYTDWQIFNDDLEAYIGVMAKIFMVQVQVTQQNSPDFHYLKIGVKYTDKRFTRGVAGVPRNVNQTAS